MTALTAGVEIAAVVKVATVRTEVARTVPASAASS